MTSTTTHPIDFNVLITELAGIELITDPTQVNKLFGDPRFPNGADVPDSRCARCHAPSNIDAGVPGFDHEKHRGGRSCMTCHSDVGHSVTATALAAAGVLDRSAYEVRTSSATPSQPSTAAAGHPPVSCTGCHDLSRTACVQCHAPRHGSLTASTGSNACSACHRSAASWDATHPDDQQCGSCHVRPANHRSGPCETCHATPASWAFRHPSGGECASCHARPANHRSGACTACHTTRSWRFTHPSSASCASCHRAPANHYGSSCVSCHRPGTAWSRATFAHPRIPGGEHTYRSFACSKCHPNGYSSATCTACHKADPGEDD